MPVATPLLLAVLAVATATAAGTPVRVAAQEPYSPLVSRGTVRLGATTEYSTFSGRYGASSAEPGASTGLLDLAAGFSGAAGTRVFPALSAFEEAVSAATGQAYSMSLGSLESVMEQSSATLRVSLDAGVLDWLTVGAMAPLVRSETEFEMHFAADSAAGPNAGFSPAVGGGTSVTAFLSALGSSIGAFDAFRARTCADGPDSSACRDAMALAAESHRFHQAVSLMYGSMLAPLASSAAGMALQARLAALAGAFRAADVGGVPSEMPLAAAPLSATDLQDLARNPAFGTSAGYPLAAWMSLWRLGDVELRANARVLEAGGDEAGYRVTAGAGTMVRLPTGAQDDPANFMDMGSGDGQTDVELRAWTNARLGTRLGLWTDLRYGVQLGGATVRRVFHPAFAMPPGRTQLRLEWDPGDYVIVEAAPWYRPAAPLTLFAGLRYYRKGRDAFALAAAPPVEGAEGAPQSTPAGLPDPDVLAETGIWSSSRVVVGFVYAQSPDSEHGLFGQPLEVRTTYRRVVAGGGGAPAASSLEVRFRIFVGLWGG